MRYMVCQNLANELFPLLCNQECCLILSGSVTMQPFNMSSDSQFPAITSSGCLGFFVVFSFFLFFFSLSCEYNTDRRAWLGQFLLQQGAYPVTVRPFCAVCHYLPD